MAQIKIYGLKSNLDTNSVKISESIHQAVMSSLEYPAEKLFHRFIGLSDTEFIYPSDRTSNYIIIEISMFAGRTVDAKKSLIKGIYSNIEKQLGYAAQDIEITIFETPKENWGIRGMPGDELPLGYKVEV